jgi:hypothetical protein
VVTWDAFVARCAEAFQSGVPETDFGAPLVGKHVRWEGLVESVNGRGKIVKGLSIKMPTVEIDLGGERKFVGDGLFLVLSRTQMASPKYRGTQIVFRGRFGNQDVLPNVSFIVDDEQQKVVLGLSLEDGEVLP